jgi:hypothetical protein
VNAAAESRNTTSRAHRNARSNTHNLGLIIRGSMDSDVQGKAIRRIVAATLGITHDMCGFEQLWHRDARQRTAGAVASKDP